MNKLRLPSIKSLTLGEGKEKATLDLDYIWRADYDNVAQAAEELPAVISWLNHWYAYYAELSQRFERKWKEAQATQYFELKNGAFESRGYGDKQTEKALEKAAILEPTVQEAAEKCEKATYTATLIRGQLVAIQAKLDLIRTSEATRRRIHEAPVQDEELDGGAKQTRNEEEDQQHE